jgi:beta-N-acetylhexosaminidase
LVPRISVSYALEGDELEQSQDDTVPAADAEGTDEEESVDDASNTNVDDGTVGEPDSEETIATTGESDVTGAQDSTNEGTSEDTSTPEASFTDGDDGDDDSEGEEADGVDAIISNMDLDEKISQLIIPAIRTWNDASVTDLAAVPDLAAALRKHQYAGVILFSTNIVDANQTSELVGALQANNAAGDFSTNVPYLMPVDEEGGVVVRFSMGTRMTGNMAIGATGDKAIENARATGEVLGEEINALGFNVDFAPSIDVNSNPANPVIGVRSFGDDPEQVANLGIAFNEGLQSKGVIPTVKHFPGHGDTGTDSHLGVAMVPKTHEELQQVELVPFKAAIDAGTDLIMTAHVTLPQYDDEVTFFNGTKGHFPATMSRKVLTDLLRDELGYQGVVVTDALEMDAIDGSELVEGEKGSAEYAANIAETCIKAGADLLLLPRDLKSNDAAAFYDEYIGLLCEKATNDEELATRIDESVTRVLELKEKYGILDGAEPEYGLDVVGSYDHHVIEMQMASEAITLVKNEDYTLPASGHNKKIVLISRDKYDNVALASVVQELMELGLINEDTFVNNLAAGTTSGSEDSASKVTIDYYYDTADTTVAHYTDGLKAAIAEADTVVAFTKNWGVSALQTSNAQYLGISQALADTHAAGGKFVLISGNLPYDTARYQDADAILCSYMSSGTDTDPTSRGDGTATVGAYNANIIAAFESVFDVYQPAGKLPVRVPAVEELEDGTIAYAEDSTLYERGHGLSYEYVFVEGANAVHTTGSADSLVFKNNARYDCLGAVLVDGKQIEEDQYSIEEGSTILTLPADYLNGLAVGNHTLVARYAYDDTSLDVSTAFAIASGVDAQPAPSGNPSTPGTSTGTSSGTTSGAVPQQQYRSSSTATPVSATRQSSTTTSTLSRTGDPTSAVLPIALATIAIVVIASGFTYRKTRE